jgi:ubiquinone/menaquinone biosynthesis C-methylase UbiE
VVGDVHPPQVGLPSGAARFCPLCGTAVAIDRDESLWPASWVCRACDHVIARPNDIPQLAPSLDQTYDGFAYENFALLAAAEERSFWFQSRNELIRWLVQRYAPRAESVLEIGCGTGFALRALRQALPTARIAASELHSVGLATARQRHGSDVELIQMDARRCHLSDALDLVGAFDVLEHIPEDDRVLAEIARILKPGGILLATVPQHPWMWSTADDLALHQRRYRRGELALKARGAGLQPLYSSSFTTLAFPFMVASRMRGRLQKHKQSLAELADSQFDMPAAGNGLLLALARVEHLLRRMGVPLPFGGSQVLVARRPAQQ